MWLSLENKSAGHQKLRSPSAVWWLSAPELIFALHSGLASIWEGCGSFGRLGVRSCSLWGRLLLGLGLTSLPSGQEGQDRRLSLYLINLNRNTPRWGFLMRVSLLLLDFFLDRCPARKRKPLGGRSGGQSLIHLQASSYTSKPPLVPDP